jgi:hypothetical protein
MPMPVDRREPMRDERIRHRIGSKYRGSRVARPNEYGGSPLVVPRCNGARRAARESRAPGSAELAGRGWRACRERAAALGVRRDQPRRRRRRDKPNSDLGRRGRQWRRAGQVPGDACRAVRLVVNVVASLARLLDMRAQSGRRASLGKGNDGRDEQLDQTEQRKRHDCRPRSRADRSSG